MQRNVVFYQQKIQRPTFCWLAYRNYFPAWQFDLLSKIVRYFCMNPKYTKLVESLTGFSTNLQKGEQVLMDAFDTPESMVVALVRAARKLRALPFVNLQCGLFVKGKLGKLSPNYLLNG